MTWQEIERRLREGLSEEARGNFGRVGKAEERLGISEGYLAKLCHGRRDFKLSMFLRSLEALGADARDFLARTLEIEPSNDDYLRQLDRPDDRDRAFERIALATRELEASEPSPPDPAATAGTEDVAELAACRRTEQLRRLRATRRYRTHAFARAYLEHLDTLRVDHAEEAARLARRVITTLIPALPGPQDGRLSLQCLALGVFGSSRRLKGRFSAATRALRLALEVSRREGLRQDTANLLLRASYLLKDFGHFRRALALLREALEIFVRLGSETDVGRVLLDQGMMRTYLGDHRDAILDLKQALAKLRGAEHLERDHLALYQYLAHAHEQLGQLDQAHDWLNRGAKAFDAGHAVDAAKLRWLRGRLAFRHGELARAEALLRAAGPALGSHENPLQEALWTLDLIDVLLARGESRQAADLATGMAPLLFRFADNPLAKAAVVELINGALESRLHQGAVRVARAELEGERAPGRGARSPR